jgi:hypothetical protein
MLAVGDHVFEARKSKNCGAANYKLGTVAMDDCMYSHHGLQQQTTDVAIITTGTCKHNHR